MLPGTARLEAKNPPGFRIPRLKTPRVSSKKEMEKILPLPPPKPDRQREPLAQATKALNPYGSLPALGRSICVSYPYRE